MHGADYAVARCLSVTRRYSDETVNYQLSGSQTILVFPYQTEWQCSDGNPLNAASNAKGVWKNHNFRPIYRFISELMQNTVIVTMKGEQKTAPKLSNGTSLNELAWPLTQISRSRYYSMSSNSKRYQIELCLQWLTNRKSYGLSNGAILNDLEQPLTQFSR